MDDSSSTLATDTFGLSSASFLGGGWGTGCRRRSSWLSMVPPRRPVGLPPGLFPLERDFLFFFRWRVCCCGLSSPGMMAVVAMTSVTVLAQSGETGSNGRLSELSAFTQKSPLYKNEARKLTERRKRLSDK